MTIAAVMKIGTNGMTEAEKMAEQLRRLKVVERVNKVAEIASDLQKSLDILSLKGEARRAYEKKIRHYNRELRRIKADEGEWLREAAWFMYA